MALQQWDNDVDRPPVGARQIAARLHQHRRVRTRPWPRLSTPDAVGLGFAAFFALIWLVATLIHGR